MECTFLIVRRRGREGERRRKRRGGGVSNIVNTFEQGEKQRNKITSYILKTGVKKQGEDGHPSPLAKLCASGAKRRLCDNDYAYLDESEMMGSASK